MAITSEVVRRGTCSGSFLASLLGLWIHVLMYRRPMLALLDCAFADSRRTPASTVFALSRNTLNELLALVMLAPLAQTDMRVSYAPFAFCMDASPTGAGLCAAPLPETVVAELWRQSEQKGYYTRLESPAAALLREKGLEPETVFGASAVEPPTTVFPLPPALNEGIVYDTLECFSQEGTWAAAHSAAGLVAHPGLFTAGRPLQFADLADGDILAQLVSLAARGVVREWHFEPAGSFGGALARAVEVKLCLVSLLLRLSGFVSDSPTTAELRAFHDDPEWVGELADSLEFTEVLRYRFSRQGHINVQEGRSSSSALGHVLLTALPYVLGGGLYPGGLHVYSGANRSDGPSRGRSVAPPTKDWPVWLEELREGSTYRFDVCLAAARVPKLAGRWLRLLLLLGGDIERHPGPAGRVPRGPLDLTSGFATSTRHKMTKSLDAFKLWLSVSLNLTFAAAMASAESAATALRAFGLHLYSEGHPRYLLVYAITGVQDAFPAFRNHLTPAWQIDKKWQHVEPGECRPVISKPILLASVSLGILWGWFDWVAVTLVGFLCMLHPSELICLQRSDLVLPHDMMTSDCLAYIHGTPKQRVLRAGSTRG
ncbi:unnamed protein product [Symbiodinium necroappetens]|uniref:Uncharacterized protein n=1 Tax=Symbiodinium necroappetens TaxID=1628268 RepID=A0A813AP97_9DINO|nr:unnamed protein product [Symbiodinium necroappetens]